MGLKTLKKSSSAYQITYATNAHDFSGYADDPIGFIEQELGERLTAEQKAISLSVRDNRETNVQASHSVGKSFLSSRLIAWFICCKPPGAFAISTGPTERQVTQILWGELRKTYDRHKNKIGGERGETFIRLPNGSRAIGFSARHTASDSFQGLHEEFLLIVIDESSGVSKEIDDAAQSCVTGANNRLLRIGNPIKINNPFHKACGRSHIRIPSWSHPNVAFAYNLNLDGMHRLNPSVAAWMLDSNGEVKPEEEWPIEYRSKVPGAVSVRWIEEVRANHGEASAYWIARVEAQFPTEDSDGIIPLTLLKQARDRYDLNPQYWDNLAKRYPWRLGLDVGDGGDPHALALLRGPVLYEVQIHPTKGDLLDTERAADIAAAEIKLLGASYAIAVDNTGVGAGTLAKLKTNGCLAYPCKFGDSPSYKKKKLKGEPKQKFTNYKAELYWQFREILMAGKFAIAPLENEEYVFQDLTATRYSTNTKDEIFCELKEKTKSRLGRSPDSEAVIIGLATPLDMGGVPQDAATALQSETNDEMEELHKLFI